MFSTNGYPLSGLSAALTCLFLRLTLKSDFRAKVATWKTENLYLQNNYSLGSGSASHTSSGKGAGNKSPPRPHLTGNLSERLLHCHARTFPQGPFCAEGKGRQEVSSNSASPPRSFIHMLGTTACSSFPSLAGARLSPSALHMVCGIVYALPLHLFCPVKNPQVSFSFPSVSVPLLLVPLLPVLFSEGLLHAKVSILFSRAQVTVINNGWQKWS